MKNIILIFVLISTNLIYSQDKLIKIIGVDNSEQEYSLDEIKDITFDLENQALARVSLSDNSISQIPLNNSSRISFENTKAIFTTANNSDQFDLDDIVSIEFESVIPTKYPFGELEVEEIIVDNLNNPWSLDFINENEIIFTEHDGRLFRHNIKTGVTNQVSGLPSNLSQVGQGGFLDVTLHPDFSNNNMLYFAYSIIESGRSTTAIGRAELSDNNLLNFEEIFRGSPFVNSGAHFGSRIVFDNEGKLYFSIGDRGRPDNAQDSTNHYGSVLRINDDGSIPDNNPYLEVKDAQPELYTMGNRNIQGMFYVEANDELWAIEHGPRGGDELNLIIAGENYAWPLATYGINYDGTPITDETSIPGYVDPITYWVPSIAPCGMDLIKYDSEKNELDIIIGTLAGQHLHRVRVRDYQVVETVRSLEGYGRFRDVQLSPDGYLYAAVQGPGRIIKLKAKD